MKHVKFILSILISPPTDKKVTEEQAKLKLQQNLYEQVRADRNLFSKQHIQSQDEISEMKRKFKIMTHQIEQLKEEIQVKDRALINEHFTLKRLKDEMSGTHKENKPIKQNKKGRQTMQKGD